MSTLLRNLLARFTRLHVADPEPTPEADEPVTPHAGDDTDSDEGEPPQPNEAAGADAAEKLRRKLERRIDRRSQAIGQRDARIAELEARLAETTKPAPKEDDDEPPARRVVSEDEVDHRAHAIADERSFRAKIADRTSAMLESGKAIEGFRAMAQDVAEDIPFIDHRGRPTPFIEAVLDTDAPAEVLAHIHRLNDELRDELAALANDPKRLVRRLTLIEIEVKKAPAKRSAAPRPLEPTKAGGGTAKRDEAALSDAEWAAQRRAQKLKRA